MHKLTALENSSRYHTLSDAELSRLLQHGDEEAFRAIYDRYCHRLHAMAFARLGQTWEAEEVVQDIFCKLWRRRATLSLDKTFEHYFSGAVKFEVINCIAKRSRSNRLKNEWASRAVPQAEPSNQLLDYHTLQRQLQRSVDSLPHQSKLVFRLRHDNGYSLQQIAHRLGISIKTVEFHLNKARKTIRTLLGGFLP